MNSNNLSLIKLIICMAGLTMVTASPAIALPTPVVDGNVTSSEGYTFTDVSFHVKNHPNVIDGGKLGHAEGTIGGIDYKFFGLILPQSIVDNTYGTSAQNYVDKYGNPTGHTLFGLEKTYKLEFKYGNKNDYVKLELDYIDEKDGEFNAKVKKFERKQKIGDDKITTKFDKEEIEFHTSLDYNYNELGLKEFFGTKEEDEDLINGPIDSPINDPSNDNDWVFSIMYEFSIEKDALEGTGIDIDDFLDLNNSKIRANSNKIGDKYIYPKVPEPQTLLLLGFGLIGLAGIGRKKLFRK